GSLPDGRTGPVACIVANDPAAAYAEAGDGDQRRRGGPPRRARGHGGGTVADVVTKRTGPDVATLAGAARRATRGLAQLPTQVKDRGLLEWADALETRT